MNPADHFLHEYDDNLQHLMDKKSSNINNSKFLHTLKRWKYSYHTKPCIKYSCKTNHLFMFSYNLKDTSFFLLYIFDGVIKCEFKSKYTQHAKNRKYALRK